MQVPHKQMGINTELQKTANHLFDKAKVMELFDYDEDGHLVINDTKCAHLEEAALPKLPPSRPKRGATKQKEPPANEQNDKRQKQAAIQLANLRELFVFLTDTTEATQQKYGFSDLYAQHPWMRWCSHDLYQGQCVHVSVVNCQIDCMRCLLAANSRSLAVISRSNGEIHKLPVAEGNWSCSAPWVQFAPMPTLNNDSFDGLKLLLHK